MYKVFGNLDKCTSTECKSFLTEFEIIHNKIKAGEQVECSDQECNNLIPFITRAQFYTAVVQYFNNPIVYKYKNHQEYSIYVCRIESMLVNKYRYIFSVVPLNHLDIGSTLQFDKLHWISLQTRTLDIKIDIPVISNTYQKEYLKDVLLQPTDTESDSHIYFENTDLHLSVSIELDKPSQYLDYHFKNVPVSMALQSFKTVLSFV
jgi:hypothetical protein